MSELLNLKLGKIVSTACHGRTLWIRRDERQLYSCRGTLTSISIPHSPPARSTHSSRATRTCYVAHRDIGN